MSTRRLLVSFLLGGLAVGLAGPDQVVLAGDGKRPAGQQAGQAGFDDRWLGEIAQDELKRFSATGEYGVLARRVKDALVARLACGHLGELGALNDMMYVFRACAYLPMSERATGDPEFAKWLAAHRDVTRRLFRALEDVAKPTEALKALHELVAADEKAVLEYPELAAAFATSLPLRHYRPQPGACKMVDSFRYYTRSKTEFRYDLKKMPFEISRYLADTRLSMKERAWAVKQYQNKSNPARSYFDVKYDYDHYRRGEPKKIAKAPYTLASLRKLGGVCIEQAYYAGEVCKALGVPAAIVSGRGKTGIGHAWVACLRVSRGGKKARWDSHAGRYKAQRYYTGELRNPATGRTIPDNELMLVGAAAQLPLRRREEADTAIALARMVDRLRDKTLTVDLEVLKAMAARYDRPDAGRQNDAKAATGWIREERRLDLAMVEDLIHAAVDRNLAHKAAWELIVVMRKSNRLPVAHLDRFFDTLVSRTAKAFPDYSCWMVMRIVPTIADAAKREKVYKRALGVYGRRADLYGRILTAMGDDYRQQDKPERALMAYEQAAIRCVNVPEVVLEASAAAEAMLLDARRRDMAINMYKKLFAKAKKQKTAFRRQTAHYQLGMRLARLLRDAERHAAAKRVLQKL